MEPHHYSEHESDSDRPAGRSQFPRRWEPVKGAYNRAEYTERGKFGARDFGSVVATTAAMQPFIFGLEAYARAMEPDLYGAGAGVFTASFAMRWFWQTAGVAALKVASSFLRNYGESLLRDLAAWLWTNALRASWYTVSDLLFRGWSPFGGRNRPSPPLPGPPNDTSPSWIDRWRNRRRK